MDFRNIFDLTTSLPDEGEEELRAVDHTKNQGRFGSGISTLHIDRLQLSTSASDSLALRFKAGNYLSVLK